MSVIRHRTRGGFTIVELLVVIVVIGILAAITIVAYNGIQQRAQNAKTASAVKSYVNGFSVYGADNGSYPGPYLSCLGEDYPSDRCWDTSGSYMENAALTTALKTTMGQTLPMPGLSGKPNSGVFYLSREYNYTLDGVAAAWIIYAVDGTATKCPVGPIATYTGGVAFSSAVPGSGQTTAGTSPGCWVPLPRL